MHLENPRKPKISFLRREKTVYMIRSNKFVISMAALWLKSLLKPSSKVHAEFPLKLFALFQLNGFYLEN